MTVVGRRHTKFLDMIKLRTLSLPIVGALSFAAFQLVTSASGGATLANGFWTI